ncbi:polysaccharide pyruvyl transferase family protein [Halopseudomonas bauzanensis]|uniref:polysaccharide pyruvyl transferase family protein n=1 Tax=Halopseudomonas bauzanensis TaxID=653930 RepID=UPI002553818B|nr:polysaccharide pyruvyl transferase family protein [Halopseudomonas bauzanensis]
MNVKRVVIAAEVFSANLGDYAIYDSLKTILEQQGIEVVPLDLSLRKGWAEEGEVLVGPQGWAKVFKNGLKKISLYRSLSSRLKWYLVSKNKANEYWEQLIEKSDGVIVGGGQLLTDTNQYFPLRIGAVAEIAKRLNKPISVIGCGVGGTLTKNSFRGFKELLSNATYISLRDYTSRDKLKEYVGGDFPLHVSPDIAFGLPASRTVKLAGDKVCGLNVIPLSIFHRFVPEVRDVSESDYLLFWKRLAEGAIKSGLKLVIMTNGNPDDQAQANNVYNKLVESGIDVQLQNRPKRPSDLYRQIEQVDYLVAMRMHAGIVGCALGRKTATIAWDEKIPGVWRAVNNEDIVMRYDILKDSNPWNRILPVFESPGWPNDNKEIYQNKIHHDVSSCLKTMFE